MTVSAAADRRSLAEMKRQIRQSSPIQLCSIPCEKERARNRKRQQITVIAEKSLIKKLLFIF